MSERTERGYRILSEMIQEVLGGLDQIPETPEGDEMRRLLLEMEQIAKDMLT